MKRYLCILFLLFGCFIFRGDYASASGVDRLVEAVYTGAGDFSTAYAYDASGNMMRDLNRGIESIPLRRCDRAAIKEKNWQEVTKKNILMNV